MFTMNLWTKQLFNDMANSKDRIEPNRVCPRKERVAKKAVENNTKKPLNTQDVVDAEDFTYEPFLQKRTCGERNGDSGSLLLATNKNDEKQKYIVKHEYCECAANEFVYSKMARAMGLKMPDVKLFRLSDPLDDALFKTEFVAGIEYLNIVDDNPSLEAIGKAKNANDFYKFLTLFKIFRETDIEQFVLADDGYIYRIDANDAFGISEISIIATSSKMGSVTEEISEGSLNLLNTKAFSSLWDVADIDDFLQAISQKHNTDKNAFAAPLFDVQRVHKRYVNDFLNTLRYFYPNSVGDYYDCFFVALKKRMKQITDMLVRYNKIHAD